MVELSFDQFQEISPGVFHFHGSNYKYVILICGPSCDCQDFKKFHWPCKHLLFIIQFMSGYSWDSLPSRYRNISMFNLDQTLMGYVTSSSMNNKHIDVQPETARSSTLNVNGSVSSDDMNSTSIEAHVQTALNLLSSCGDKLDNEQYVADMCNNLESLVELCRKKTYVAHGCQASRKRFKKWIRRSNAPRRPRTRGKKRNKKTHLRASFTNCSG